MSEFYCEERNESEGNETSCIEQCGRCKDAEIASKTKHYSFTEGDGQISIGNKAYWEAYLNIAFPTKKHALEVAESIIRQVDSDTNNEFDVQLNLVGKFEESEVEEY